MPGIFGKYIIGKCCKETPICLVKFNGAPSPDYSVLICKLHLNKKPYDKNILLVNDLETIESGELINEGKTDE